jgi:hypothetical protein
MLHPLQERIGTVAGSNRLVINVTMKAIQMGGTR